MPPYITADVARDRYQRLLTEATRHRHHSERVRHRTRRTYPPQPSAPTPGFERARSTK